MGASGIFVIRAILSIFFAFLLTRFFFEGRGLITVFAMAAALLGLAYVFEYAKKRDRKDRHEQ